MVTSGVSIIVVLFAMLLITFILILPLQMAASAMGAKRTGAIWCILALLAAGVMQTVGTAAPVLGNLIAFLLSALVFAALLDTTFVRGIGIAILHIVFSVILIIILVAIMGVLGISAASL